MWGTHSEGNFQGIALWLAPSTDEDVENINSAMQARRQVQGSEIQCSPSSYPRFHPHITLASIPSSLASSLLADIRSSIPKFVRAIRVEFESIEVGTHFFRSVYIAVKPTPPLLALHAEIHKKLKIEENTPAFPHISLCYIDDQDALQGERNNFFEAVLSRVRQNGADKGGGISLKRKDNEDWLSGFLATELWIANCDGPVSGWTVLDKIPIVQSG